MAPDRIGARSCASQVVVACIVVSDDAGGPGLDQDLWESHADWWIEGFTDGADPEYEEQILPLAESELAGFATVLDIGCGDGQISRLLAGAGSTVVGIDPTWNQIRVAGERGGGASYVKSGAAELPFADAFVRRRGRLPRVRAHRRRVRRDRRGGAGAAARRAVQLLPQPSAAPDPWQRVDQRPHAGSTGVVLADRAVPRRAGFGRAGRTRSVHPLRAPTVVRLCQRARAKPGWCSNGWSSPRHRLVSWIEPPNTKRRPRSRASSTSASAESTDRAGPARSCIGARHRCTTFPRLPRLRRRASVGFGRWPTSC